MYAVPRNDKAFNRMPLSNPTHYMYQRCILLLYVWTYAWASKRVCKYMCEPWAYRNSELEWQHLLFWCCKISCRSARVHSFSFCSYIRYTLCVWLCYVSSVQAKKWYAWFVVRSRYRINFILFVCVFLFFFDFGAATRGKRICVDAVVAAVDNIVEFDGVNPHTKFRTNNRINAQLFLYSFVITYIRSFRQILFHGSATL